MAEFTGNQDFIEVALAELEASMPAIIARREIPKYVGGTIATGTLANLGRNGPPFFYVNKYATYEKKTFLQWLRTQIKAGEEYFKENSYEN